MLGNEARKGTESGIKGWNEMKPCPGSWVVKSCYLVVFRFRGCKVTFTRKVSLGIGGTRAVTGDAPSSAGLDRSWGARPGARHLQHPLIATGSELGEAAV